MSKKLLKHLDVGAYDLVADLVKAYKVEHTPYAQKALKRLLPYKLRAEAKAGRPKKVKSNQQRESLAMRKADEAFSDYIRTRDTSPAGETRIGNCVTCGKVKEFGGPRGLQCGHWIRRGVMAARYLTINAHAQCQYCNHPSYGAGEEEKHAARVYELHGKEAVDQLLALKEAAEKGNDIRYTEKDFKEIQKRFENETQKLLRVGR